MFFGHDPSNRSLTRPFFKPCFRSSRAAWRVKDTCVVTQRLAKSRVWGRSQSKVARILLVFRVATVADLIGQTNKQLGIALGRLFDPTLRVEFSVSIHIANLCRPYLALPRPLPRASLNVFVCTRVRRNGSAPHTLHRADSTVCREAMDARAAQFTQ